MPPFRPTSYPRFRVYVCPACITKLQGLRRPPWLIRNSSTQVEQKGRKKAVPNGNSKPAPHPDDNVVIRRFEQTAEGSLVPVDEDLGDDTVKLLKSRIAALEADLQKLKTKDSASQHTSALLQLISSQSLPVGGTSLSQPISESNRANLEWKDITIPFERFPEDRRKGISKLNHALQSFARQPSNSTYIKDLWKWYSHCRVNLTSTWHVIPSSVWNLLWEAFSRGGVDDRNRPAHIRRLGEDMKNAGARLDRPQKLLYLESLFLEGNGEEAVSQWEAAQTSLAYDRSTASKYWELGVRMLANENQPERAEQATDVLINGLGGENNHRVLIGIIRSWLESDNEAAVQRAWAIYVRFKYLFASEMEMRDYDAVAGAFLEAHETDMALAVFRDMMLCQDPNASDRDSVTIYRSTIKNIRDLTCFRLAPEETSWRSHEPFTILPRDKQNKYFYGSWIKKLIGDGEVDWAAQVAGLMYQRQILPDPKHMNGIIGAWLRSGTASNQRKAEDLAWKMIGARVHFVELRDQRGLERPLRPMISSEKKNFDRPSTFSRVSTLATVETFCILINFYLRRRRGDRVQEICSAIKTAKIKPNTSFLNDVLLVGAMQNRKQWTWNAFNQLVDEDGVEPDHDTFTILWQLMKDNIEGKSKSDGFPSPRVLFAQMAKWPPSTKTGALSRDSYELVLDCFILIDDQLGCLIALRAMQHLYDLYPNQDTLRNIIIQLAKTGNQKAAPSLPRRQERAQDMKSRVAKIAETLKEFKEKRTELLQKQNVTFDNMDDTTQSEELILLLSNLLDFAVTSKVVHPFGGDSTLDQLGDKASTQHLTLVAAQEMGVPQCTPRTAGASNG